MELGQDDGGGEGGGQGSERAGEQGRDGPSECDGHVGREREKEGRRRATEAGGSEGESAASGATS